MEKDQAYVDNFLGYLKSFIANIRSDDPLPVRAPSYKVTENEIDGQIIDTVYRYLSHRDCPPYLRNSIAHTVWKQMRNPEVNGHEDSCDTIDHSNHTYEPVKLIQDVANRTNKEMMHLQASLSIADIEALPRYLPVCQYAIKNTRRKMEDRHVIIQDLNTLYDLNFGYPHAYYGVFDGHAGTDAAVYSAAHLHQYLIQNPLYETDPVAALKHAFYITDTNFVKKANKERLKGGTTAVVALVREKRLVVAWLGDSQALLVRKRDPVHVVEPHKPESPGERKRIEGVGGCVVNIQGTWRVLGQLAVSRAIGDCEYKPFITSECDIKSLEINGDEDFMILACDGLWDTLKPADAVNIVYSYLSHNNGETDGVGRCLVEAARALGSDDNITAVVVFLRPVATLMEEEAARVAQGEVSSEMDPFVSMHNDSLPRSINAIFSPPDQNAAPVLNSSPQTPQECQDIEKLMMKDATALSTEEEAPQGGDLDSDEGVGAEIPEEEKTSLDGAIASNPTEAEVDAALAELDSIPDGACEVGDLEDDSSEGEEEEDWKYYKMKPQMEPQEDDLLFASEPNEMFPSAQLVPSSVDEPVIPVSPIATKNEYPLADPNVPSEGPSIEPSVPQMNIDIPCTETDSPGSASPTVGSPKTVEGFITSVELNSPEESYNTNLTINQSTDYFNAGQLEQNSGPFSVYVSSSPEPASIEVPPQQQQSVIEASPELSTMEPIISVKEEISPSSPSVEIVHAQSTVEVCTPKSPSAETIEPCLTGDDASFIALNPEIGYAPIPDIMTQSMTGDTHPNMFSTPDPLDVISNKIEDMKISEPYNTFNSTDEDLFKNIPETTNFLEEQHIPVDSHKTHKLEAFVTDNSIKGTEGSEISAGQDKYTFNEPVDTLTNIEPCSPIGLETANQANTEPDLVKDLEQFQASITEPLAEISPMDKIQQEFEQIEQAAEEFISSSVKETSSVVTDLLAYAPVVEPSTFSSEETSTREPEPVPSPRDVEPVPAPREVQSPRETEPVHTEEVKPTPPAVKAQVEKPKKETPKAAPRTSTSRPAAKTTPRTGTSATSSATSKTLAQKDQSKETSRLTPRVSRLSTTPKFASKPDEKKPTPTSRPTTSRISSARTTKTSTSRTTTIPDTAAKAGTTTRSATNTKPAAAKAPATSRAPLRTAATSATRKPLYTSTPTTSTSSQPPRSATTKSTTTTSTRTATTSATKRPITTRPLSSSRPATTKDSTKSSSVGATKTSTLSTTGSLKRPTITKAPITTTKDSKNTTNRILSTRTATSTTSRVSSAGTRTTTSTRTSLSSRQSLTKTGLKTKSELKTAPKTKSAAVNTATANGENKITEEEVTCESKAKLSDVTPPEADLPAIGTEGTPISEETAPPKEVLVNGNHH